MERAERNGFAVAAGAHIALFGALSLGLLSTSRPLPPVNDPIDVQLVDAVAPRSAAPRISTEAPAPTTAPARGPPEEAAPAPEPTPPAPRPEPTPAPPVPKPAPKPTPPAPAPKPAPKPAPAPPPKPAPSPKPQPARPAPAKAAPAKPAASAPARPAPAKTAAAAPARATPTKPGAGTKTRSTGALASNDFLKGITPEKSQGKAQTPRAAMTGAQANALGALIREQLKPYWAVPPGTDVDQLVTTLRVRLNKDGSLAGPPEVLGTSGTNGSNKGYVRQHQDAARRAVLRAAPFRRLPADYYDEWKVLEPLNFDNRLSG